VPTRFAAYGIESQPWPGFAQNFADFDRRFVIIEYH
jgi:hypothetical protein